ncbi:MAG: hypothetical protein JOY80_12520, partial [Candidatus Dormibacteraeota bacterium]|nr:hypothetical protein [Candidatus Dormibacteraeota bacterium]
MSLSIVIRVAVPLAVAGAAATGAFATRVAFAANEAVQIVTAGTSCTT